MDEKPKIRLKFKDTPIKNTTYEKMVGATDDLTKFGSQVYPGVFAKEVMIYTGASYSQALREVKRRRTDGVLEEYMRMVRSLPKQEKGSKTLCVTCLGSHQNSCPLKGGKT